ncbi:MAG: response regulator [Anaerolineae bacterium]|nr:response regulator [Anaerolineae bacterium]
MLTAQHLKIVMYGLIGFFLCSHGVLSAQELNTENFSPVVPSSLRFQHLTSNDGLAQNTVHAIMQDSTGFMWFGTEGGLSRYDGYDFLTFEADANDRTGFARDHITALMEDSSGTMWIATEGGGVYTLDPKTMEISPLLPEPDLLGEIPPLPISRVKSLFQDQSDNIWLGGDVNAGLSRINPVTGLFDNYRADDDRENSVSGSMFLDMIESENGQIWFAAGRTVDKYDLNTGEFSNYVLGQVRFGRAILEDHQGQIWLGTDNGLYLFDETINNFEHVVDTDVITTMLEPEPGGILWLGTNNGVVLYDIDSGEVVDIAQSSSFVSDSLNNVAINEIYQDVSGLIWIGGDSGIDVYDPMYNRFELYRPFVPDGPYSLTPGNVQALTVAYTDIGWVGVGNVLHKFDFRSREVVLYSLADYGFPDFEISAVYQDQHGLVWIGGNQRPILLLSPTSGEVSVFDMTVNENYTVVTEGIQPSDQPLRDPPNNRSTNSEPPRGGIANPQIGEERTNHPIGPPLPPGADAPTVVGIVGDNTNGLWVIRDQIGIFYISSDRSSVTRYDAPEADPVAETGARVRPPLSSGFIDSIGDLWLTSGNGLSRFDVNEQSYHRYPLIERGADTPTEDIIEESTTSMWIASQSGLIHLNPSTGETRLFTKQNGLPSNHLLGIERDDNGDLWISSDRGLSRFDPATEIFQNYDKFDGLQGMEFENGIAAKAPDGRLVFGGSGGLTAFFPNQIVASDYQTRVIFSEFDLFNQPVELGEGSLLTEPIWQTQNLTLAYDQNYIAFEFAALNFVFDDVNQYRYVLEGFDTEWTETDSNRRFASYPKLPPGDYTFRVQAANRGGIWSSQEASLSLNILPPWWATTGFRLLAASLILGALGLVYMWRVQHLKRRSQVLEKQVKEKTKALVNRTRELEISEAHLRKAKDEAEAANRTKSAFLANMSHELRSPLNAILGFAQVTKRSQPLPSDAISNLDIILKSGDHLLTLINQVLDLSKLEAGRMILSEQDFDLYQLLDELEDMFKYAAREKHLAWYVVRDRSLPQFLSADVTKLRQTLINLIGNAFKFTREGSVTLSAKCIERENDNTNKQRLAFTVADTGFGIEDSELNDLFKPFSQTSAGIQAAEGSGLGLSISHRFAQLMGGDIQVESQVGRGSIFTLEIACNIVSHASIQPAGYNYSVISLAPDQPQYRILVVDDIWENRQFIVRLLEPLGFLMREAENGKEAVEIAQSFKPHLIWMDIYMPVMDGIDATEQIKAAAWGQPIKIVALTASVGEEDSAKVTSAGCDGFLRKPLKIQDMFNVLGQQIGAQFITEEPVETNNADRPELARDDILTALATVPDDLITRLRESAELGDISSLGDIIRSISERHQPLADALKKMVDRFDFDELLDHLKEVQT